MFDLYAKALLPLALAESYTYKVPEEYKDSLEKGMRVHVPFQSRTETAIIEEFTTHPPDLSHQRGDQKHGLKIKSIIQSIDPEALVNQEQIALAHWLAERYLANPGEALFKMFPKVTSFAPRKAPPSCSAMEPYLLTTEQENAYHDIRAAFRKQGSRYCQLLHGITGSGKTEIYIHLLRDALMKGKSALFLVPEISLTVQLIERLKRVFSSQLALLHSGLRPKQRFENYLQVLRGEKRIAVGTRSAVFAPLQHLGVIILDEEHDSSFKEHSSPRYDARQVAQQRASSHGALLLLGSATPRVESVYHTRISKAALEQSSSYHILSKRAQGQELPQVEVLELRDKGAVISPMLLEELGANLRRKEQSILLLNRRGYFPQVYCQNSKEVETCPACAVSLNLHRNGKLICHYCSYQRDYTGLGSDGGPTDLLGTGIQKLEDFLIHYFPKARIERLDSDAISRRSVLEDTLLRFLAQEIDILVGTQMIARGLDAPQVSLVGVLQAEKSLYLPDFRSTEKTFALLTQAAGRAGRSKVGGRVFFECMNPEHPIIQAAACHDYAGFYQAELPVRKAAFYPPFSRIIRLLCRGPKQERIRSFMRNLAVDLENKIEPMGGRTVLLGPAPAPIEKTHNKFREHILIKSTQLPRIRALLADMKEAGAFSLPKNDYLEIDCDPVDIL